MNTAFKHTARAAACAAALVLVGCRQTGADNRSITPEAPAASSQATAANDAIRAAAEPFEVLTEESFASDWTKIDRLSADASKAVAAIRGRLNPGQAAAIDMQLAEIAKARAAQDRVGLALASVEGYRMIVEAQDPATANPPIPLSLLDYAGFRYDALAQAPNVDWQQMAQDVIFAQDQWRKLAPSIPSKALPGVMDAALGGMAKAVEQKNVAFARSAAATELALVDLLEEQVAAKPPAH
jgi:hypothetical protein